MNKVFIHEKALVEAKNIGEKSRIWAYVHILAGAQIGKNANICDMCFIENDVVIGNNVTIKSGVSLWDGILLEDDVFIGPSVAFTNDLFPRSKNTAYQQKKTTVQKGASIGANATILAGITIGTYALIGAGSVVAKNVGNFSIVYGNPAVHKGYICVCSKKLSLKDGRVTCPYCKRAYSKIGGELKLLSE